MANTTAIRVLGDHYEARKVINGVLVHISASGVEFSDFRTYYPVGGRGLFYNGNNKRRRKRIPSKMEG